MTDPDYFDGNEAGRRIFRAVQRAMTGLEGVETRLSKSQTGFYRAHPFAAVWQPDQYLKGRRPPLVLTLFLRRRVASDRWKEVVEPSPGRFTHHLELRAPSDVDAEVRDWLAEAWREAG
ncbi:MAG: hypothetical protein KIT43_08895 [Bauldia sp.]|nr:hypothetical protein [Bauldia sp.]MCW5716757.1 hypothetical protein [Bauldia sp.]